MNGLNDDVIALVYGWLIECGTRLLYEPARLRALLSDHAQEFTLARHVLWISVQAGVPYALMGSGQSKKTKLVARQQVQILCEQWAIREDVARWVVDAWSKLLADPVLKVNKHAPRTVPKSASRNSHPRLDLEKHNVIDGHSGVVTSLAFSPSGRLIASGATDKTVRIWEALTGKERYRLEGHTGSIRDVAFSPTKQQIASASDDKTIRVWEPTVEKVTVLNGHKFKVLSIAYNPDGKLLASASYDKTVRLWQVNQGTLFDTWNGIEVGMTAVAFSGSGLGLVAGSRSGKLVLKNIRGDKQLTLDLHSEPVTDVVFSPDRKYIISSSKDCTVRIWSLKDQSEVHVLRHDSPVQCMAIHSTGQILVTGTEDAKLHFWNPLTAQLYFVSEQASPTNALAFSPDGQILASAARSSEIHLWRLADVPASATG